jgi:DNA mismatch repair protein MutS
MAMLKEYFKLSKQYREKYGEKTILLFQVGAFYEVYTEVDAKTKEIVEEQVIEFKRFTGLASANKNETTLMLGFRDYIIDKYVEKIQENGYTAVVYSQDAPSSNTTRSLTGIFSPGTFFSVNNNDEISNNLACIWVHRKDKNRINKYESIIIGMSNMDVFTGKTTFFEVITENVHNPTSYDELERFISTYNPSETIMISNLEENRVNDIINYVQINSKKIHRLNTEDKRVKNAEKQTYQQDIINRFFSPVASNAIIHSGYEHVYAVQSFVYLLNFVFEHNPNLVNKIHEPVIENNTDRMLLANHSLQQLNIIDDNHYHGKLSSVSNLLNNCITTMGKRTFKHNIVNPTTCREKLEKQYDITEYLLDKGNDSLENDYWRSWRNDLKNIKDIEKLNRQIYLKKITPQNLFHFNENLSTICSLFSNLTGDITIITYLNDYMASKMNNGTKQTSLNIDTICTDFQKLFKETFIMDNCKDISTMEFDTNFIKRGVNTELDSYIDKRENSIRQLESIRSYYDKLIATKEKQSKTEYVKVHETDKSGINLQCTSRRSKLLIQQIQSEKNSVQLEFLNNVNGQMEKFDFNPEVHSNVATGSNVNLSNACITRLCSDIFESKQKMKDLITIIYNKFINDLQNYDSDFLSIIHFCSSIDLLQNMCYIATKYNYHKPTVKTDDKSYIIAKELRHPLIEQLNSEELYVTNDVIIGLDNDLTLLYGTNAVGKTSIIRALGINLIMAQSGLYVACSEFEFVPYTGIFTRILGNDNLFKGLSTFAVEMSELRVILNMANKNSLILGDELCSGTEHDSAVSIFVSGLEMLHKRETCAIFATHLHEIVHFEEIENMSRIDIKHLTVSYNKEKDKLIYDRKLKDGPGESMYGLEVCKSLHLPDEFLENAYQIRRKYKKEEEGILSKKSSHFNSKKIMGNCELCKNKLGTEVHHLQHQEQADKNNMIKTFHKNHPANLMTLCEDCHQKFHKTNKQHKKVKTSIGIEIMEI